MQLPSKSNPLPNCYGPGTDISRSMRVDAVPSLVAPLKLDVANSLDEMLVTFFIAIWPAVDIGRPPFVASTRMRHTLTYGSVWLIRQCVAHRSPAARSIGVARLRSLASPCGTTVFTTSSHHCSLCYPMGNARRADGLVGDVSAICVGIGARLAA
jgi:hypothetical protein